MSLVPEIRPRPSSAFRWAQGGCTGSVQLAARYGDPDSEGSEEGKHLHALAACDLRGQPYEATAEERAVIQPYVDDVRRVAANCKGPTEFYVEQEFEFQPFPALRGTPDCVLKDFVAQKLTIWDFKSGWKIVEAFRNYQLLTYAMLMHPPQWTVDLRIVQPRPFHADGKVRSWELSWMDLQPYRIWIARAARESLEDGRAQLKPGTHCAFCPALAGCPAARDITLGVADRVQNWGGPADLPDEYVGRELRVLQETLEILKLRTAALEEDVAARMRSGRGLPGLRMKENSGGRRNWTQSVEHTAALLKMLTGQDHTTAHLPTPKQLIEKGVDEQIVRSLSERTPGKMVVSIDDGSLAEKAFGPPSAE